MKKNKELEEKGGMAIAITTNIDKDGKKLELEGKMVQSLQKTVWQFFKNLNL